MLFFPLQRSVLDVKRGGARGDPMVHNFRPIVRVIILSAVGWATSPIFGLRPIAILEPDDKGAFSTNFGWSVAISGDYIAVGAPLDPCYNADSTGAVYVFRRLGPEWIQVAKLTAPDAKYNDQLGYSVAMEGDIIVAGAPKYDHIECCFYGPGAVYVFRRHDADTPHDPWDDSWQLEERLEAQAPELGQAMGFSVAISGERIVAGKYGNDPSAEVFRHADGSWIHEASLVPGGQEPDEYAKSVGIHINEIVVGAPRHASARGSAYLFSFANGRWSAGEELFPENSEGVGLFGESVSINHGHIAVGAPYTNGPTAFDLGAGFAFGQDGMSGWIEMSAFTASDLSYGQLGLSIDVDFDLLVIGRYRGPWAFIFQRNGCVWIEKDALAGPSQGFALSASLDRNYAAVNSYVYAVRNRRSLNDYRELQNCFGTVGIIRPSCQSFDLTDDEMVDLDDHEQYLGTFVGPHQ